MTHTEPNAITRLSDQLRARRAAALADPNTSPLTRKLAEASVRYEAQQREQQERDDARQRAEMRRLFPRVKPTPDC